MHLENDWGRLRRPAPESHLAVRDIILNCKEPAHDTEFARKHGMSVSHVAKIRRGKSHHEFRRKVLRKCKP